MINKTNFISLKDLLLRSISKSGKKDNITKSIIWNEIIFLFKEKKNIDIAPYLISIKITWNIIIIKTLKPIVNTELLLYKNELLTRIKSKLEKTKIILKIEDIKTK